MHYSVLSGFLFKQPKDTRWVLACLRRKSLTQFARPFKTNVAKM